MTNDEKLVQRLRELAIERTGSPAGAETCVLAADILELKVQMIASMRLQIESLCWLVEKFSLVAPDAERRRIVAVMRKIRLSVSDAGTPQ